MLGGNIYWRLDDNFETSRNVTFRMISLWDRVDFASIGTHMLPHLGSPGGGCNNLGYNYDIGRGVTKDFKRANALHEKACELGNRWGCHIHKGFSGI